MMIDQALPPSEEVDAPTHQTRFMAEEPWLEDNTSSLDVDKQSHQLPPPRKKLIIVAIVVVGLMVLLGAFLFVMNRPPQFEPEATPVPSVSPTQQVSDPFMMRFNEVKADLEIADPTKQELVFPPVNLDLNFTYTFIPER